jgi:formate C-acetyltransferase
MDYFLKLMNEMQNVGETVFEYLLDEPFAASTACPGTAIERGKGIKRGGAKYTWTADNVGGVATAGNSLAAIKKLVFDDKTLTGTQLMHALETNFEDETTTPTGPEIMAMCISCPKHGNDEDYVDLITRDFLSYHCRELKKYRNRGHTHGTKGGFVIPSSSSVTANIPMGETMGATPDGRKAKKPPSEAASAAQGELGPRLGFSAYINSLGKIRDIEVVDGQLRNFTLSPDDMKDEVMMEKFIQFVRTFFDKQGYHMQFNVVNAETLLDAKKKPDKYTNLIVRVAAYSAFFVELDKEAQNDIISRVQMRM